MKEIAQDILMALVFIGMSVSMVFAIIKLGVWAFTSMGENTSATCEIEKDN